MKRIAVSALILISVAALLFAVDALTIGPTGDVAIASNLSVGGRVRDKSGELVLVGTIAPCAFSTVPADSGWLVCDGRVISSTDARYVDLVALLRAEAAGNPNHPYYHADPDKAYLPDLRGRFARGLDTSGETPPRDPGAVAPATNADDRRLGRPPTPGADPAEVGAVPGSVQEDAFQGHRHNLRSYDITTGTAIDLPPRHDHVGNVRWHANPIGNPVEGSHGPVRISTETRPENVAVNYIIKY